MSSALSTCVLVGPTSSAVVELKEVLQSSVVLSVEKLRLFHTRIGDI